MNPTTDILFVIIWFGLFYWAIRSMIRGWSMMTKKPPSMGSWVEESRTVTKSIHPEMRDVKSGDQLMVVNFEKKTSCDLEEYQALQERIEELKLQLEEDDDEDDDGNVPAIR